VRAGEASSASPTASPSCSPRDRCAGGAMLSHHWLHGRCCSPRACLHSAGGM
jgi:hypothetical protein